MIAVAGLLLVALIPCFFGGGFPIVTPPAPPSYPSAPNGAPAAAAAAAASIQGPFNLQPNSIQQANSQSDQNQSVQPDVIAFADLIRQRSTGNRQSQCPCVLHPQSGQCIVYDSRYLASTIEEAMLAFLDLSGAVKNAPIVNGRTFTCQTPQCLQCFGALYYRFQRIGLIDQKFQFVTKVLPRDDLETTACPRLIFPQEKPVANPPPAPAFVRAMISAGRSFSRNLQEVATAAKDAADAHDELNPGVPKPDGPLPPAPTRLNTEVNTQFLPSLQRVNNGVNFQNNWIQNQLGQFDRQLGLQLNQQQQQQQQQQTNNQLQQINSLQQARPNIQQQLVQQQFPQQLTNTANTLGQRVNQGTWNGQSWNTGSQVGTQPVGVGVGVGTPQTGWNGQTWTPGWNSGQWGTPGAQTGWTGGQWNGGQQNWPFAPQVPQTPSWPGWSGGSGNNGNGNGWGGGSGGGWSGGWGASGGGTGGGTPAPIIILPFGKKAAKVRAKRQDTTPAPSSTPQGVGERFDVHCSKKGENPDDKGMLSLCGTCWSIRKLPEDYFPRYVNERSCSSDNFCLSGWGTCTPSYRPVEVVRMVNGRYVPATINSAQCCDCRVQPGSSIHALIVG
ncbi:unnamed protein product, partial [Mesorhabditis belari]|uniref:Uncharacterized protein n=1 Tax=Mesorhabditis belari TaxID=2138241 RepID=A0AAF3FB92_9BILA